MKIAAALLGIILLILWPILFSSPYDLKLLTIAGSFAILAIGYQFIFGDVGELSLAQGGFFGFGAYVTGLLAVKWGAGFEITMVLSIVAPVLLAALISIPVLRLSTHYFALATLGVGQILLLLAIDMSGLTGGALGLTGVPLPRLFDVFEIKRGVGSLIFVWSFVLIAAVLAAQVRRGAFGIACQIVRESPLAAKAMGINPDAIRLRMFLMSAAFAGAAGALYAHTIRVVSPEALDFKVMVSVMTIVVIGGRTSVWGAIAAALLIVHLPEWLKGFDRAYVMITSGLLLLVLYVAPSGLGGLFDRLVGWWSPPKSPVSKLARVGRGESVVRATFPSETPILSVSGLSKSFGGVHAIEGVTFSLMRGSITAVIGPNGSGKSTLINCITGVYHPEQGDVMIGGSSVLGRRQDEIAALGIARTFQNLRLAEDMTVLDNVAVGRFLSEDVGLMPALIAGVRDEALERARADAFHTLVHFGLGDVAHTLCASLPHGIKRVVEIARAVCLDPMVILLDEPAAGLNETEQAELARHLEGLAVQGMTLLIVEHNLPFLRSLATHMVCLDDGKVIADGRPEAVYQNKRVIEAYIGIGHQKEVA